ncbi:hypothetical protein HRR90_002046 [Exophiala dermatitidis]|nr:hypothetical protein HRR90_002046 [Exophiala dermatitidis]
MDVPSSRDRDSVRPEYTEYFCPGEGIEREVIQHEICKYLGQDATCRPTRSDEARQGYWVKAYRPFTTAMVQSLREETIRWQRERERRARQGRTQGSYAEMQARQEMQPRQEPQRRYPGDMELDDDDYARPQQVRHREQLEPRTLPGSRVAIPATQYPPDPGYPAGYTISSGHAMYASGQSPYPGSEREREPRTFAGGNTTPPSYSRSGAPGGGYGPSSYPSRTAPPVTSSIPGSYDLRRDVMGAPYASGYPDSRRHR